MRPVLAVTLYATKKSQPGKTQRLHRETGEDFETNIPPDNALGVVLFRK